MGFAGFLYSIILGAYLLSAPIPHSNYSSLKTSHVHNYGHSKTKERAIINYLAITDLEVSFSAESMEFIDLKSPHKALFLAALIYTPKLLYFNIGQSILANLPSTAIIFPFHFFT